MKLGRKAVKHDSRTLKLAAYLTTATPPPPDKVDWTKNIGYWGMMNNDTLGCCTICGCAHAIQIWSANTNKEITVKDSDVVNMYEKWDGYNPSDPSTDCGGVELDVLNNWKSSEFVGHKLYAYTAVNLRNIDEVKTAINLFGGIYIGIALPLTAQNQDIWDLVPNTGSHAEPGSWGGHCVFVVGYDDKGFSCITWGEIKKMTPAFFGAYVDEAYALIGADWFTASGVDPQGLNLEQLQTDLAAIR